MGLIPKCTYKGLVELNDLRVHFAHHPGGVRLTAERVQAIKDAMVEGLAPPPPIIVVAIKGDITARSNALQDFLAVVAALRVTLGDRTQGRFTGETLSGCCA